MDSLLSNKFKVLRKLKVLLKYLNLYNKFGWFGGELKLFKPLTYFVLSLPLMVYFLVPLRVCILYNFDLEIIASPLMVTLGTLQGLLMFYSFALNHSLIMQTVDALQQLVQKSVIHFPLELTPIQFCQSLIFQFLFECRMQRYTGIIGKVF